MTHAAVIVLRTLVAVYVVHTAMTFDPSTRFAIDAKCCFSSALVTSVVFGWRVAATHAAVWVGMAVLSGISYEFRV
jgi:hypothetical protein